MPMKNRNVSLAAAALTSTILFVVALSAQSRSSQPAEHSISSANVKGLSPKWVFTEGGDVLLLPWLLKPH
jgi:hypothetical protein